MSIVKLVNRHVLGRFSKRFSKCMSDIMLNIALSRWAFGLMAIRVAQLVSLQNSKSPGDFLLGKYHYFLGLTRPANWISTSEAFERIEIIFIIYLSIMSFLQLVLIRNAIKEQTNQSMKLLVIIYKNMGKIFDFLLFIPMVEILCTTTSTATSVPMITSTAKALKLPLVILLSVVSVIYFVGELFDVPLKTRASNHLLGSTRFLDIIRTIMSIPLVVIATQTNNQFAIGIPSSIYAFILILLGMMCRTYRNKTSRRVFLMLSAYYFIHSFTLLFIDLKQKNQMYVISNTFSLFLFLAVPFGMKLSLVIDDLITSKAHLDEAGFLGGLTQRREREMLSEILNDKNDGKINLNANGQLGLFISDHLNSCKDTSCFCNTWSLNKTEDMNEIENLRIEFIENYYEKLLTNNQSKQIDTLIELVLFQAFYLDRPFKACFTWSRFRSMFRSSDQRFILDSLLRLIEESYLDSLSKSEVEFQKIEFHRGITFESDYGKVLDSIEAVRKTHCELYQYLVDSRVASTDKIYSLGSAVQKSLEDAKQKTENLTKIYADSPEAMILYSNFNREILYASTEEIRRIEAMISHLIAKKHERKTNNEFNTLFGQFKRFDYFDMKNIFLEIDLSSSNGLIRKYNSFLISDLGIERESAVKTGISLRTILPRGIRDEVPKTLTYINSNLSSQVSLGHYLSPVFLSHASEVLLPYKASMKIEFDEDGVFAAAVLQKLRSNSQFILTKPSGEIISLTQGLLKGFELQHVNQVQGLNICFFIPKLFKYYLNADEVENSASFPHDGIYTKTLSATACLSNEYLTKYNKTARAEVENAVRCLDELNKLQIGQELEKSKKEEIIKYYAEAIQQIDLPFENTLRLTLRVQKYEYLCSRFRVIEIYNYKIPSQNKCSSLKEFVEFERDSGIRKSTYQTEESPLTRRKRFTSHKSTFFQLNQTPIRSEAQTAFRPSEVQPGFEFILPNYTEYNFSEADKGQANLSKTIEELRRLTRPTVQRVSTNAMLFEIMEDDDDDGLENFNFVSWQDEGQDSQRTAEKLEIEKQKRKADKILKKEKQKKAFAKRFFSSASSQGSSATSVLDKNLTLNLIQKDMNYRILDIFLILGLLGVVAIFVLFTIQCIGARGRLQALGELSRSTRYPMINSAFLDYIARNAYQFELAFAGVVPMPLEMMIPFLYVVVPDNNGGSVANLKNMALDEPLSEMLYERMESPKLGVTLNYPNSISVNMSIKLASNVIYKASDDYYKLRMLYYLDMPKTQMDFALMSSETYIPGEMCRSIGVELMNKIHSEISSNFESNTKIIGIIALLITVIGVGFLLVYNRIVNKRAQILGLFCRVSKNDLLMAWERMSGLQIGSQSKGGKKSEYNGIIRNKEREKARIVLAYYSNSRTKYMGYVFVLIVGIFMIPFLVMYIWVKNSLVVWEQTAQQVDTWGVAQARLSTLIRLSYEYYYSLQGDIAEADLLSQRMNATLQEFGETVGLVQDFFSKFGNLPNQDIYDEATTEQINGGKVNICPYLNTDPTTIAYCYTITFGVLTQGAIATLDAVRRSIIRDWYEVSHSSTPIETMQRLSNDILTHSNFEIIVNSYLFRTYNMMQEVLNNYIRRVSRLLLVLYCGISVGIIVVLGVFWMLFLKKMQHWLNKSKSLLQILPPNMLKTHSFILNYLKKELKYSSG